MTRTELLNFLKKHRLGVLATVSPERVPEAAVVGIAVTDNLELIFDTRDSSRKSQNLRKNPKIAFVIGWDADEISVQYEGVADEPKGPELDRLKETYFAVYPEGRKRQHCPGATYYRVRPLWARYSDFLAQPEPVIIEFTHAEITVPDTAPGPPPVLTTKPLYDILSVLPKVIP